jgi:hypothetical protein
MGEKASRRDSSKKYATMFIQMALPPIADYIKSRADDEDDKSRKAVMIAAADFLKVLSAYPGVIVGAFEGAYDKVQTKRREKEEAAEMGEMRRGKAAAV